jgi:hypothetical protein
MNTRQKSKGGILVQGAGLLRAGGTRLATTVLGYYLSRFAINRLRR